MELFFGYVIVINLIGLGMMYHDKQQAIKRRYRIPERRLWLIAVIGGSLGCTIGMYLFHHKTRHLQFKIGFPLLMLLHGVLLGKWLLSII